MGGTEETRERRRPRSLKGPWKEDDLREETSGRTTGSKGGGLILGASKRERRRYASWEKEIDMMEKKRTEVR